MIAATLQKRYKLFVGGAWIEPEARQFYTCINPATNEIITEIPAGNKADIDQAVEAAWGAYKTEWHRTDATKRGKILCAVAQRIREHQEELAQIETLDNGKPIVESRADLFMAAECFEYYGGLANKIEGKVVPVFGDRLDYVLREPWGVVGQIVPWNFPVLMAAWKLAPALAAGNCSVLKPAEQTPLSALRLAELMQDLLPKGV
ncbi:aldehyde dehydrogenase family protein, partial [Candidatus Acetothermia bacterium]|nr:aldehyde dehydrogenase family protein [Candidatus Acetothermia bacterium]